MELTCPLCESPGVAVKTSQTTRQFKGTVLVWDTRICVCDACGLEYAGAVELNFNAEQALQAMRAAGFDPDTEIT